MNMNKKTTYPQSGLTTYTLLASAALAFGSAHLAHAMNPHVQNPAPASTQATDLSAATPASLAELLATPIIPAACEKDPKYFYDLLLKKEKATEQLERIPHFSPAQAAELLPELNIPELRHAALCAYETAHINHYQEILTHYQTTILQPLCALADRFAALIGSLHTPNEHHSIHKMLVDSIDNLRRQLYLQEKNIIPARRALLENQKQALATLAHDLTIPLGTALETAEKIGFDANEHLEEAAKLLSEKRTGILAQHIKLLTDPMTLSAAQADALYLYRTMAEPASSSDATQKTTELAAHLAHQTQELDAQISAHKTTAHKLQGLLNEVYHVVEQSGLVPAAQCASYNTARKKTLHAWDDAAKEEEDLLTTKRKLWLQQQMNPRIEQIKKEISEHCAGTERGLAAIIGLSQTAQDVQKQDYKKLWALHQSIAATQMGKQQESAFVEKTEKELAALNLCEHPELTLLHELLTQLKAKVTKLSTNGLSLLLRLEQQEQQRCVVCGKHAQSRCTRCEQAYYCCPEHQKEDWKAQHKTGCSFFLMEGVGNDALITDAAGNRYPVLTVKDILIFEDPTTHAQYRACFNWQDVYGARNEQTGVFCPVYLDDLCLEQGKKNSPHDAQMFAALDKANKHYRAILAERAQKTRQEKAPEKK